jgi:hypothetical protein
VSYRELVSTHGGADAPLLVLTDEELAACSPDVPEAFEPVRLEAIAELSADERAVIEHSSLRSLAARGLVAESGRDEHELELQGVLAIVTGARADAVTTTVATRSDGGVPASLVLYALEDGPVLTDQVRGGIHVLHLVDHGDAVVALATFLDPHDQADESSDGRVLEGSADTPPSAWDGIRHTAGDLAATVTSRSTDRLREVAVFPTPEGVWVVGALDRGSEGAAPLVRAVQLGPTSLVSFLSAMLGGVDPDDEASTRPSHEVER